MEKGIGMADHEPGPSPAWVLLEKGRVEFERKEYGNALLFFQQAVGKSAGPYPEAEEAIGDVYRVDGEWPLALRQYYKAYNAKSFLSIKDTQYRIQMKMVAMYRDMEAYKELLDRLLAIVNDDPFYADPRYAPMLDSMINSYRSRGLDALMRAYRVAPSFALQAHAILGWFYYRTGRDDPAIRHLILASNAMVAGAVSELRLLDMEYQFSTLDDMIQRSFERDNIAFFLQENGFFETLYYLACASHSAGYQQRATDVWRIVASSDRAGRFQSLASAQLRSPLKEPVINPSSRELPNSSPR
jgi:tetratricopeptide (TPR) repeat protein